MPRYLRTDNSTRTEPTTEPVTPEELRARMRTTSVEHDKQLQQLISAARKTIELVWIRQAIMNQTCVDKFGYFAEFELRWSPAVSITSIQYVDNDGTTQTLSTDVYELGNNNGVGVVRLKFGQSWPNARTHPDSIVITYVAGFGATAADIPPPIKSAIIAKADYDYDGACDEDLLKIINGNLDSYTRRECA